MRARRTSAMVTAVVSLVLGATLLAPVAPASATQGDLGTCLRSAHKYHGGMLFFSDGRTTQTLLDEMVATLWAYGRKACWVKSSTLTMERVGEIWAALPEDQRPDTVLVGVPGTTTTTAGLLAGPPIHRLVGSSDSGLPSTISWGWRQRGRDVALNFLRKVGEVPTYGGGFSGTSDSWLVRSTDSTCARAAASPNGILIIGDSITYRDFDGIRKYFSSKGWIPCVYAQRSARVTDMLRQLRRYNVPVPKSVVVALGNNDVFTTTNYRYQMHRMRTYLGPDTNVVWTTIWRTRKTSFLKPLQYNAKVVNRITRDVAGLMPNSALVDWYSVAITHPGWMYDGIHLTYNGLQRRYSMFDAAARGLLVTNPA
jgi:hypothetical protein